MSYHAGNPPPKHWPYRQPDDTSGTHSRRCLCCHGKGARGSWRLCRCCDPAPWWASLLRWLPYVQQRWF